VPRGEFESPRDGREPSDEGATRIGFALLAAVLASAALLALGAIVGEPPRADSGPHPLIPGMQIGGDSAARAGALLWIGAAFGLVQIAFFGLCFALGMRQREGLGPVRRPLLAGLAAYAAVWIALIASYVVYAEAPEAAPRWLGFPLPTAILLFGFWPLPVVFVGIYLRYFDRFVLDPEKLARFRERLAELRSQADD